MEKVCSICGKPPESGKGVRAGGKFYCCYKCVKHDRAGKPEKKNVCEFC